MTVHHGAAVTTVSWIPSEAIEDAPLLRAPFTAGVLHYDTPPPDRLPAGTSLDHLAEDDAFRFAHRLAASIEVDDGRVVAARYDAGSGGSMGGTTVRIGGLATRVSGIELPLLRRDPEVDGTSATFEQTYGGRTGLPSPRLVGDRPRARWRAPIVWTTLRLTLHADGRHEIAMPGASRFPRHWIFGPDGELTGKSALTAFNDWYHGAHGGHTPWGTEDAPARVVEVESELERVLATTIMRGGPRPAVRNVEPGQLLVEQGQTAGPIYVVLDGVLAVEVDGEELGQLGPGAVVGERAHLESGTRTATLRALTRVRVAEADVDQVDERLLDRLSLDHRREER